MQRRMMKSKIHRSRVTDANLHDVGSITVDRRLMGLADIREWEQVHVVDIDDGARLETYVIPGGSGDMCLNGAAERLAQPGDRITVISDADDDDAELDGHEPIAVHVDASNRPVDEAAAADLAAIEIGVRA